MKDPSLLAEFSRLVRNAKRIGAMSSSNALADLEHDMHRCLKLNGDRLLEFVRIGMGLPP